MSRWERAFTPLICIATKRESFNAMENKESFNAREREFQCQGKKERTSMQGRETASILGRKKERACAPLGHPITKRKEKE